MANLNLNKVIIGGRLTSAPELKTTQSGVSVTSFSVAINRKPTKEGEQVADFLNVVAWRKTAELVCNYFKKGSSICLCGSIQVRNWTDNNGQKRTATEIIADEIFFVDSKSENAANNSAPAFAQRTPGEFEDVTNEDDLPF